MRGGSAGVLGYQLGGAGGAWVIGARAGTWIRARAGTWIRSRAWPGRLAGDQQPGPDRCAVAERDAQPGPCRWGKRRWHQRRLAWAGVQHPERAGYRAAGEYLEAPVRGQPQPDPHLSRPDAQADGPRGRDAGDRLPAGKRLDCAGHRDQRSRLAGDLDQLSRLRRGLERSGGRESWTRRSLAGAWSGPAAGTWIAAWRGPGAVRCRTWIRSLAGAWSGPPAGTWIGSRTGAWIAVVRAPEPARDRRVPGPAGLLPGARRAPAPPGYRAARPRLPAAPRWSARTTSPWRRRGRPRLPPSRPRPPSPRPGW